MASMIGRTSKNVSCVTGHLGRAVNCHGMAGLRRVGKLSSASGDKTRAGQLYKDLINAIKLVPLDKGKSGRDLGELIRKEFLKDFDKGEDSMVDCNYWLRCKQSMELLTADTYDKRYVKRFSIGVSGLAREHCSFLLSNDVLKTINR